MYTVISFIEKQKKLDILSCFIIVENSNVAVLVVEPVYGLIFKTACYSALIV